MECVYIDFVVLEKFAARLSSVVTFLSTLVYDIKVV